MPRREDHPARAGRRIDADFLRKHIDDFGRFFYVCRPPGFLEDLKRELVALGADMA